MEQDEAGAGDWSAKPFDLRHAVTLSVNARLRYRFRRLGGVIWEIPVEERMADWPFVAGASMGT
jgi:hypothetical protein